MSDVIERICKDLYNYAEKKHFNGEVELANGILKAKCYIEDEKEKYEEQAIQEILNNQPQVQPIVRTPEEIAYYKCCKACGLNARCERENQRDCDEFLEMIDWLTGKEVE